jgi:hypothetical protein
MGKQISVKCDQMPHCGAHKFVVKGLKVVCPSPEHVLFLRIQDGSGMLMPGSSFSRAEIWLDQG